MRMLVALLALTLVNIAGPASADSSADTQNYAAKCKAASFARSGPGTWSTAMRNAQIERCIKNKGFLD